MGGNRQRIGKTRAAAIGVFAFLIFASLICPRFYGTTFGSEIEKKTEVVETAPEPTPRRRTQASASRMRVTQFPHSVKAHQTSCGNCHKFPSANWKQVRQTDAFPDVTDYPRHESCLNCHRQQFFKGNPPQICSVCHTNPSPRNSARFAFPNPREIFDLTAKGKTANSDFQVSFPHGKHIEIVSQNESATKFVNAVFNRKSRDESEKSCAVCHQTYQPQGDSEEEYATKPPANLGEGFWLKKGTFKSLPISHAKCFACHSQETGILPAPSSCAVCHKLKLPAPKTDFDAKLAAMMKITDKITLQSWQKRDSSGKFRHEFSSHADLSCATCHNVAAMQTTLAAAKKVAVTSCNMCHISATSDDGGILNYEIDQRQKDAKFQCTKCHLTFGKQPIPESHFKAVEAAGK